MRFKPNQTKRRYVRVMYFNSTLVRFKRDYASTWDQQIKLFQFHSGAIQTQRMCTVSVRPFNFNSTLVRFKQNERTTLSTGATYFNSTLVRFKPLALHRDRRRYLISIPLWCDSNINPIYCDATVKRISIPLWCDSNPAFVAGVPPESLNFNSTLVRFKRGSRSPD